MRVLIDTQILIYLHPKAVAAMTAEEKNFHVRARILAEELGQEEAQIIVPTICISEYLTGCDPTTWVDVVKKFSEQFECPPFDLPAAQMAAKIRRHYSQKQKGAIYNDRRNVLSSDVKILGTALAQNVTRMYSGDSEFRKLAGEFVEARDLPTKSHDLFLEKDIERSLE